MKFYQLLLLFTLCLIVVNAFSNLNDIPLRDFALKDPFDGDVMLDTCVFNQGSQKVYCSFENSKYVKKGLFVTVPITKVENGPFQSSELLSGASILKCNSEGKECEKDYRIATTSPWEIIEGGDSYEVSNRKIEVDVYTQDYHKEIYLYYDVVKVNKLY